MSKSVLKYRVYCQTEEEYTYTWGEGLPTTCPNNNAHTIDDSTITILDTINTNSVIIQQESTPTGGNYRAESKMIEIDANETKTVDTQWPYPLSVLTLTLYAKEANDGDIVNTFVAPGTVVGVVTQNASQGATTLSVNSTVTDNIGNGYRVNIFDGQTSTFLGECISVDKHAGTIIIDTPVAEAITAGVYVQICINNIKNFALRGNTVYELARKTIGASSLPANATVRLQYENTTNEAKTFFYMMEYYY